MRVEECVKSHSTRVSWKSPEFLTRYRVADVE